MVTHRVSIDPEAPTDVEMRVHTPLFAEVSMYYRRPSAERWTEFAYFDISEVDDGMVAATAPALDPGGKLLLRVVLWGGDRGFHLEPSLRQNRAHCQGSPLPPVRDTTGAERSKMVDVEVELV